MKIVTVNSSKTYDIKIGPNLLTTVGKEVQGLGKVRTVCILSESTVYPLYGERVKKSLSQYGFTISEYILPAPFYNVLWIPRPA